MIRLENTADVIDALTRGAPGAYAREFGGAYDPAKVYYVCSKETWAAVVSTLLRVHPHGLPPEVASMQLAFNAAVPLGRVDVGYRDHHYAVVVEIEIKRLSFGDRARIDLVDAVKASLPSVDGVASPVELGNIVVAASSLTWHLLFDADPRLADDDLPKHCLGCRVHLADTVPDGVFIVRHISSGAVPRIVEIPLT